MAKNKGIRIPEGKTGEISKIAEEYFSLRKASNQKEWKAMAISSADLILAVTSFLWRQCYIPFLILWPFVIIRALYRILAYCFKVFLEYPNGDKNG